MSINNNLIKLFVLEYYGASPSVNVINSLIDSGRYSVLTTGKPNSVDMNFVGNLFNFIKCYKYNDAGVYQWALDVSFFNSVTFKRFLDRVEERLKIENLNLESNLENNLNILNEIQKKRELN